MSFEFLGYMTKRTLVAKNTYELSFSHSEDRFAFYPGQYLWVVLPKLNYSDKRGDRRAFSITSSAADQKTISILYRDSDSGYKKTLKELTQKQKVKLIGPFGSSYIPRNNQKNIVMIAGGTGIAPFLSIIRSLGEFPLAARIVLVCVNSSKGMALYYKELEDLARSYKFDFINQIGEFEEDMLPKSLSYTDDDFLVCGPEGMVDEVYKCLTKKGVPFGNMHFEQHYPNPVNNLTEEDFKDQPDTPNIMLQAVHDSKNHVIITDANGRIIFANKTAEKNTGYSFDEMRGNTPRLWGGLMSPEFYHRFWKQKHTAEGFDGEIINRRKNGETYEVITHISPIFDKDNTVIGYIGTEEDVSELLKLKNNLEQQNKNLEEQNRLIASEKIKDEALLLGIGEGVIVTNEKGEISLINNSAEKMLQINEVEFIGKDLTRSLQLLDLNGNEIEAKESPINKLLEQRITVTGDYMYKRSDGTNLIISMIHTPVVLNDNLIGTVQIFRDVTHEKEVDRMKTEFISLASHQLRTPLSAMKWFSEMLIAGDAGNLNKEQLEFVKNISDSNDRMIDLVNSLLNISRIESGRIVIEPRPTDLQELIREIIDEMQKKIDDKKLKVIISVHQKLPRINLDPKMIRQVFINLLTNAIKYTPSGGQVEVFISKKEDQIISQISDTGVGIPKNEQEKIFNRFFRASNVVKVETDGTGLGLYLAKAIIESSGGKIWFKSQVGEGSSFWFSLPIEGIEPKKGEVVLNS